MYRYFVKENRNITPTTILLTLQPADSLQYMPHRAGQYAVISFRHKFRPTPMRCFSIVSSPTEPDLLQFSMRTNGHFTRGLASLLPGDNVSVQGPYGGFVFDEHRDKKTVLIAGGIGITPYIAMLRYVTDAHVQNEIRLLYSCANQDDIPFFDELQALQARNIHLKVLYFIGKGPTTRLTGMHLYEGRISPEVLGEVSRNDFTDKTYFICGPPPFMNGMLSILRSKNTPLAHIVTEAFGQGANRQTGKIRNWPSSVYVVAGLGMAATSFIILVSDFFRTLPPSAIVTAFRNQPLQPSHNSRQLELDSLVSGLNTEKNTALASPNTVPLVVTQTIQTTNSSPTQQSSSTTGGGSVSTQPTTIPVTTTPSVTSTQTPVTTTTSTPAPTPAPNPTPAPKPVCTTSPSGVVTCK